MARDTQKIIKEYLRRAKVDSIDKLEDLDIVFLYNEIDLCSYAYFAYKERVKRSKKDAHELAELIRHCVKNGILLNSGRCMKEGVIDSEETWNMIMSAYEYDCWL